MWGGSRFIAAGERSSLALALIDGWRWEVNGTREREAYSLSGCARFINGLKNAKTALRRPWEAA